MFNPANQPAFTLALHGTEHDLHVLAFSGTEALNQPYRFDLELVSERPDLDLQSLLHRPAFLAFDAQGAGIHGQVIQAGQGESGPRLTRYRLTLVPRLAYLAQRINQRIFQQLSVPRIIAQVLKEHGILDGLGYRFALGPEPYPPRDYCTQYGESDLHFLNRLCEEEGIHYHFAHTPDGHVLVFGDDQAAFPRLAPVSYQQGSGMVADTPVVKAFGVRLAGRPHRVTRRDYHFEKPRLLLEAQGQPADALNEPDLEDYDYPGRLLDAPYNTRLARRALERHRADYSEAHGRSDQPALCGGHFLDLAGHPRADWNGLWLLTEVRHEGKQPQVLEESISHATEHTDGFQQGYRNHFTATPWDAHYRPPLRHPKPRVLGSQTAVVTGPAGEEIHCDRFGRVKVQFHWDREGQGDDKSSCWLRVASGWAGNHYGGIAIPRVGMEVLVTFLEGDPDQPLVSGCLYHGEHLPPYELPAHKTRSLFKSLSSPGGEGYNELRIEDRKGAEQIYIHAQRDWDQRIGHDQRVHVAHERHDTVVGNTYSAFQADEHRTTEGERQVEVRGSDHLSVANEQHVRLGTGQFVEAGQEIHLKAGAKVVIDAGSELTLKAGGSFIRIDASGVSVNGALIKLNSGGSPGSGTAAAPLLPGVLQQADSDRSGFPLTPAQIFTFQRSALFCAECEACKEGICER